MQYPHGIACGYDSICACVHTCSHNTFNSVMWSVLWFAVGLYIGNSVYVEVTRTPVWVNADGKYVDPDDFGSIACTYVEVHTECSGLVARAIQYALNQPQSNEPVIWQVRDCFRPPFNLTWHMFAVGALVLYAACIMASLYAIQGMFAWIKK